MGEFQGVLNNAMGFLSLTSSNSAMGFSMGYGPADDNTSKATMKRAVELGCTFWDTAAVYGFGHNEELIGQFLKETGTRDKVFVASKCAILVSLSSLISCLFSEV